VEYCPICLQHEIKWLNMGTRDAYSVTCPRCGQYNITRNALANIRNTDLSPRQRANSSGWLFDNPGFEISTINCDWLFAVKTISFHARADKVLLTIEKGTEYAGQYLRKPPSWLSASWSINNAELNEILQYLESSGRLHRQTHDDQNAYKITPGGWEYLERLKGINPASHQCFVAMWFDETMKQIYDDVFTSAIMEAGYLPHRVDQREYNDKIDDEIIVQIRRSRFVVADFTGHRGGVYYEAGFAKGLGLEVIWTCRKDEIDKLHFDIRQYNCIDWEVSHLREFSRRLRNRIERVFGHGSYQPS